MAIYRTQRLYGEAGHLLHAAIEEAKELKEQNKKVVSPQSNTTGSLVP